MKMRHGWLLLWFVLSGAAWANETILVQLNWYHQFEYAGFYAAQKNGYYKDAGLDVEIRPWDGRFSLEMLTRGEVDVAVMGSPVLELIAKGHDVQLLGATFQHSPLVFLSHEPILRLKSQLQGKRIMGAGTFELQALLHQAGLSLDDIELVQHSHDLADFIEGRVDLYSAFYTNQPFQLENMGVPFWILDPKSYGIDSYQDLWVIRRQDALARPQVMERFRQATIQGWHYAIENVDEMVEYIQQELGSSKTRQQLLDEAESSIPLIDTGEYPIGTIAVERLQSLYRQLERLGFISEKELNRVQIPSLIFQARVTQLTAAELAWIREHPIVRLANDIDWPPFEFIDEQGHYRGMVPELLQLVSQRTGLEFVPVKDLNWQTVVERMKQGRLDMFSAAVATPERKEYARFTEPFFYFPMVALAREGHPIIPKLTELEGERIGVVAGYSTDELLSKQITLSSLHRFTNLEHALNALVEGQIDVLVDNLVSLNYLMREKGLDGLAVVGQLELPFELSMGVQRELPLLYSIISKTLASIDEEEKRAIYNRWLHLKMVNEMDHSLLLKVVGVAALIVLILFAFIGWQRKLGQQLNQRLRDVQELTFSSETRPGGELVSTTDSFVALMATRREALIGKKHPLFEYGKDTQRMLARLEQGREWNEEINCHDFSGKQLFLHCHAKPHLRHGRLESVRISCTDITSKKLLERASLQDSLTGLSNRRHFNQIFEKEVMRARRDGKTFYWAMLDLDHFKNLNDELGHQQGDKALKEVADVFREHFSRAGDGIFRLGGEEFGLRIQLASDEELRPKLEALREAVEKLNIPNPVEPRGVLTISIGAVIVPPDVRARPEWIYHQADEMLYQAKAAGRNRVMITRLSPETPQHAQQTGS